MIALRAGVLAALLWVLGVEIKALFGIDVRHALGVVALALTVLLAAITMLVVLVARRTRLADR